MNPIALIILACLFFIAALGWPPIQSYSNQAIGIITSVTTTALPGGLYDCSIELSYNADQNTLIHQVPLRVVSTTQYTFGQTITIYYNRDKPLVVSITPSHPADTRPLIYIIAALSIFFVKNS
jgi:hypothetical protein